MLNWYCIATKPRQEHKARDNLRNQTKDVYLPMVAPDPKKPNNGPVPLFFGYLFIEVLEDGLEGPNWQALRNTPGVQGILGQGLTPERVPVEIITRIFEGEIGGLPTPDIGYQAGDNVRVLKGSFEGVEGVYQQPSGEMRNVILMNILGNRTRVTLDNDEIEII